MISGQSPVSNGEWVASFGVWPFVFVVAGLLVVLLFGKR